jgi:hypothetical protein
MEVKVKSDLAGEQLRSYTFWCAGCEQHRTQFARRPLKPITAMQAARLVREDGWSKKKDGWYCSDCKNK